MTSIENIILNFKRINSILEILLTQNSSSMRNKLIEEQAVLGESNFELYQKLSEAEKDALEVELFKLLPNTEEKEEPPFDNIPWCPGTIKN